MKSYTLSQLADAQTYKDDKKLFGLARTIAESKYQDKATWLAYRDEIVSGQHAQVIFDYINAAIEAERIANAEATKALFAKIEKTQKAIAKLDAMKLPDGIKFALTEEGIIVNAPWDGGDLAERLSRKGGKWNRERKCFIVPVDAAPGLPTIFTNWAKVQAEKAAEKAAAAQKEAKRREQEQAQRQAQWAEEKRQRDVAYAAQQKQQAKARAERVQVKAGQYKIGDILEGKPITGFGKSWEEGTLSGGQLWQECDYGRCENEPVCVHCFKCSKHCGCDTETYCYAYFS